LLQLFLPLAFLATAQPGGSQQAPDNNADQIANGSNLVVKVLPNRIVHGGGIIVGRSKDNIYIVTVRHILQMAGSPGEVQVTFRFDRTHSVTANVDTVHPVTDESFSDIALLSVPRNQVPGLDSRVEFNRLGVPDRLRVGDRVISVGCPSVGCFDPGTDERVLGVGPEVSFLSQFVKPGKSGGALLNEWGEITGMILKEETVIPVGRAMNINAVLRQVREWRAPVELHRPTYPRGGYALDLGGTVLFSSHNSGGRVPSGRLELSGHLQRLLDWHLGVLRLAPNNLAVTAATVGLAVPVQLQRITASAHLDGGIGRAEARHDLGGYSIMTNGVTTYIPNWASSEGFGFGGGFGLSMKLLVAPRTFVEIMAARWTFQTPVDSPPIPDVFFGAGLRWAIR
jgi:hypothetical protein